eukprot:2069209-Pyramimonas_sp.AAC.3
MVRGLTSPEHNQGVFCDGNGANRTHDICQLQAHRATSRPDERRRRRRRERARSPSTINKLKPRRRRPVASDVRREPSHRRRQSNRGQVAATVTTMEVSGAEPHSTEPASGGFLRR